MPSPHLPFSSLAEAFEDIVRRNLARVALPSAAGELTYDALNRTANRLAHRLLVTGGAPGRPAALLLANPTEAVVAILAALKAGRAYVPLDANLPATRLAEILSQTQPSVLVTDPVHRAAARRLLKSDVGCRLTHLVDLAALPAGLPDANPGLALDPHTPSAIYFTSGSTGRPKGVVRDHRLQLFQTDYYIQGYGINPADRLSLLVPLSVGMSDQLLFGALLSGASLHPPDAALRRVSGQALARWLDAERITVYASTPTLFRQLCAALPDDATLPHLRLVWLSGETVSRDDLDRFKAHFGPECRLVNSLGAVEAGDFAHYAMDHTTKLGGPLAPAGYPVPGKEIWLLDDSGQPVGPGEVGEIAVCSAYLSAGYWRQPALTADRFRPDPHDPARRLYLTGDLGRQRIDGCLEHLGRRDWQVKVRGTLIELESVEAAIRHLTEVRDAAVVARPDPSDENRLVAYVVPAHLPGPTASSLRRQLARTLPEPLIPSVYVTLERLPMTATGKVDRPALPPPGRQRPALETPYAGPRSANEQTLAAIWAQVLGLDAVGIHDRFDDLGGNSLQAMRIQAQVAAELGVELAWPSLLDTPTVAELSRAMERHSALANAAPAPRPTRDAGSWPLSPAQERIWFVQQLQPQSPLYNLGLTLRMTGTLELGALERALSTIVQRHESLRTTFPTREGQPVQRVAPPHRLAVPSTDLAELPLPDRESELARLTTCEVRRPFDLARGPLLRLHLYRLHEFGHVLCLVVHHLVFDGWSQKVLLSELAALYAAYLRGCPSPLPELTLQPADLALTERQQLEAGVWDQPLADWRERLRGTPAGLALPTDRPQATELGGHAGSSPSGPSARLRFEIPPPVTAPLRQVSRQHAVTPFVTLLVAWQALLARLTGQEDLVVGVPIANRKSELAAVIGFMVNTLPFRLDLRGNPRFIDLLAQARGVTHQVYAHAGLPLGHLVESLRPDGLSATPALFGVLFVHRERPGPPPAWPGLEVTVQPLENGTAEFDLVLAVEAGESGWPATLEYRSDLFQATTAEQITNSWLALLAGIAADPTRRVGDLPLLDHRERRIRVEGRGAEPAEAPASCVPDWIRAQAAERPDAVAVVSGGARLTYSQLDLWATHLARHLRVIGCAAGREAVVGVCLERSMEMVAAALSVLYAGAAYLPLNPAWPALRLAQLLGDSGATHLLAGCSLPPLPGWHGKVIQPDRPDPNGPPEPASPLQPPAPGNLAYVITTSGSTGAPKGVMVEHRSLASICRSVITAFDLTPADRVMQFHPFSFDASAEEIWPTLATGATLVLRSEAMLESVAAFLDEVRELEVSVVSLSAALWHTLALDLPPERVDAGRLRLLVTGGEKARWDAAAAWRRSLGPAVRLVNVYGPTEATIVSTLYEMPDLPDGTRETGVPIGQPLPHARAYVLDRWLSPTPPGLPGELYLGGDGPSRGYVRQPALTAQRFLPDPFSNRPGARMVRTGDRVRRRPDDNLVFLGRLDRQVKVSGFRVEPAEVEELLLRHPAVRQATVVTPDAGKSGRLLAAFVVLRAPDASVPTGGTNPADLRRWLAERLPDHMAPGSLTALDALPLTPAGKVDQAALLALAANPPHGTTGAHRLPSATESLVVGIVADLLGRESVRLEDSFAGLGGSSLGAIRLLSRLRQTLAAELPLRAIYDSPTLADLARRVDRTRRPEWLFQPIQPPEQADSLAPAPLSAAQERMWRVSCSVPGAPLYHLPLHLKFDGDLDTVALQSCLTQVTRRHAVLRSTVDEINGELAWVPRPVAAVRLPQVDLADLPEAEHDTAVQELARQFFHLSFDLATQAPVRALLLRLGARKHILLLTLHHAAADGGSAGVLAAEIAQLYSTRAVGDRAALPAPSLQQADYMRWQREWLESREAQHQIAYWRRHLRGFLAELPLPASHPRPPSNTYRYGRLRHHLPSGVDRSLQALARQEGVTRFMTVVAGLAGLLFAATGLRDLRFGTLVSNRHRPGTEGVVGLLINTVVLRLQVDGDQTVRNLLQQVRRVALEAYDNQDVPFEAVVDSLRAEHDLANETLFQVMLVQQEEPGRPVQLPGLTMTPLPSEVFPGELEFTVSTYDWIIEIEDWPGELALLVRYNADQFDRPLMERILADLERWLGCMAEHLDRPLGDWLTANDCA